MMGKQKGERRKEKEPCGAFNPDGALPLFIGGGDHVVVRGCKKTSPNIKTQALRRFKITPKSILLKTKPIVVKIISNLKKIISKII